MGPNEDGAVRVEDLEGLDALVRVDKGFLGTDENLPETSGVDVVAVQAELMVGTNDRVKTIYDALPKDLSGLF